MKIPTAWFASALVAASIVGCVGCEKPTKNTTTVEIVQVQRFGSNAKASVMDIELRFAECPGDVRRVVRADKAFAECIGGIKAGDKLTAALTTTWSAEKASYRSEIDRMGTCALKVDPKDEANYETVQVCSDVIATGAVVGVRCEKLRSKALTDKCPWLRRN